MHERLVKQTCGCLRRKGGIDIPTAEGTFIGFFFMLNDLLITAQILGFRTEKNCIEENEII